MRMSMIEFLRSILLCSITGATLRSPNVRILAESFSNASLGLEIWTHSMPIGACNNRFVCEECCFVLSRACTEVREVLPHFSVFGNVIRDSDTTSHSALCRSLAVNCALLIKKSTDISCCILQTISFATR